VWSHLRFRKEDVRPRPTDFDVAFGGVGVRPVQFLAVSQDGVLVAHERQSLTRLAHGQPVVVIRGAAVAGGCILLGEPPQVGAGVDEQLTVSGRLQVNTALAIMDVLADHLDRLRRRLLSTARGVTGARASMRDIYGVGPLSSLALCAWLGGADRFSSSRKAVRFVGLDITVHSSDGKRSPGRLSRQGPQVLRWLLFEAAKTSARACAPGYDYYTACGTATTRTGPASRRPAGSSGTPRICSPSWGDDALTIVAQPAAPTTIAR
jgi:transposase